MFFSAKIENFIGFRIIGTVLLCGALTACASSGNQKIGEFNKPQLTNIIAGQVKTKPDALRVFGEPDDIDFDSNGNEKWTFNHQYISAKPQNFVPVVSLFTSGADELKKKVVLVFDKNGSVINSAVTEAAGEIRTGLTD